MKKVIYTALLAFMASALIITLPSCDSEEGPAGPKGEKGEQGIQGIPGVAGKDGSTFYSGNGAPAGSLGSNGDMYLDKGTSNLYGPKSASGWGTPLNLKGVAGAKGATGATGPKGDTGATGPKGDTGATGPKGDTGATGATGAKGDPGAAGSKILSGTNNPSTTIGAVGDFYLNKTTGDLFGPKTTNGWGSAINLKGTANVVGSQWIEIRSWGLIYDYKVRSLTHRIPTPFINAVAAGSDLKTILDNGGILLVYLRDRKLNSHFLMPTTLRHSPKTLFYFSSYAGSGTLEKNDISVGAYNTDGSALPSYIVNPISDVTHRFHYRYVVVPAGRQIIAAAGNTRSTQEIDWESMSYEEMKEIVGWDD